VALVAFLWESNHHICWGRLLGTCCHGCTLEHDAVEINIRKFKKSGLFPENIDSHAITVGNKTFSSLFSLNI